MPPTTERVLPAITTSVARFAARLPVAAVTALGALLAVALGACSPPAPPPAPTPRHLILVVFDTLRADRTSLYGYQQATTPFLDSLASESIRFARAKAPAPWTMPSHASIFTGLWPVEHGVHWGNKWLDDGFETLAESLQTAGFCTFALSSNPIVSKGTGFDQGFDWFHKAPQEPHGTQTERLFSHLPKLFDRAAKRQCRLFLFINLMDTHTPFNSSEFGDDFGLDAPDPITGPGQKWEIAAGLRPFPAEDRRVHAAAYDASVRAVDKAAGDLVDQLAERGLLEDALLVFTSDHGEGLGTHAELGHVISMWEEQLAVPLLVRFPGGHRGGAVVEEATSLTHLTPTALDWLGVPRPATLASRPTLEQAHVAAADYRSYFDPSFSENQRMKERYPQLAESVHHTHITYCSPHKLVVRADRTVELYNLETDPEELLDLAATMPEVVRQCTNTYRASAREGLFMPFSLDLATGRADTVDEETLRSLGYID